MGNINDNFKAPIVNIDNAIGNCTSGTRNLKLVQSRLIPKSRSDICIVGTVIEEIAIPYEIQTFITKMNPRIFPIMNKNGSIGAFIATLNIFSLIDFRIPHGRKKSTKNEKNA